MCERAYIGVAVAAGVATIGCSSVRDSATIASARRIEGEEVFLGGGIAHSQLCQLQGAWLGQRGGYSSVDRQERCPKQQLESYQIVSVVDGVKRVWIDDAHSITSAAASS